MSNDHRRTSPAAPPQASDTGEGTGAPPAPAAVVIGGANLDFKSQIATRAVFGTSNPGGTRISAGGVGRNIAENLGRLGVATALVTAVGRDDAGERLIRKVRSAGVDVRHVVTSRQSTGTYTAVLDPDGELIIAVADMDVMNDLTAGLIDGCSELLASARILILDCNVPADALCRAAGIARDHDVRVIVDPVSVAKAIRIRAMLEMNVPVHTVTPNLQELQALTGADVSDDAGIATAATQLHALGVAHVWVRLGTRGSFLSSASAHVVTTEHVPPCPAQLIDATGAGDAMLAGYTVALLRGANASLAVKYGRAAAAITIESPDSVDVGMSFAALEARATSCM